MDLGLKGRCVVVTGAASGLGKATAELFAREGARIVAADISPNGAESSAARIRSFGGQATAATIDVTSRTQWSELLDSLDQPVDALCNIAGPGSAGGHLDTDDQEWQRQIDGHLRGVFLGCQAILPSMIERRYGKIVNICSFAAHGVLTTIPAYSAAFGGILSYTKSLARFAAPHNVNVNCVSPGNIQTPLTEAAWLSQPGALDALRAQMPIGRVGQPEDVAPWIVLLASDVARHAVGIEINISGGQLI